MLTRSSHSTEARTNPETDLVAYCIVERPDCAPTWTRCGQARVNRDGSVNVQLDALPLSGELHLRPVGTRQARSGGVRPQVATRTRGPAPVPLHS